MPYKRDTCEVLLCEGTPGRYLEKKDVFVPDGTIFDLNVDGKKMKKYPGRENRWIYFQSISHTMAYLKII